VASLLCTARIWLPCGNGGHACLSAATLRACLRYSKLSCVVFPSQLIQTTIDVLGCPADETYFGYHNYLEGSSAAAAAAASGEDSSAAASAASSGDHNLCCPSMPFVLIAHDQTCWLAKALSTLTLFL